MAPDSILIVPSFSAGGRLRQDNRSTATKLKTINAQLGVIAFRTLAALLRVLFRLQPVIAGLDLTRCVFCRSNLPTLKCPSPTRLPLFGYFFTILGSTGVARRKLPLSLNVSVR